MPEQQARTIVPFILKPDAPDYVPIDSIAVSGHKFIGAPYPCGVTLFRKVGVENYRTAIHNEFKEIVKNSADLYKMKEMEAYLEQTSIISGTRNYYMTVVIWKRIVQLVRKGFEIVNPTL